MILAASGMVAWLALTGKVQAQSSDALIDKLVDKGILTVKEANDLRDETDKNFNSAYSVKSGMPDWVSSFKINGDMRGRYEGFYYPDNDLATVDRNRWRYRARLGFTANINDNFEVGLRLSSGEPGTGGVGGDPISSNTTMTSNGSRKFVYLDLAYGKWTPVQNSIWSASTTVGKMENPFVYSDMVFDGDYTPEGLAEQISWNLCEQHVLKFNLGGFVINELQGYSTDTYLSGAQIRLDSKWNKKLSTSSGIGVLALNRVQDLQTGDVAAVAPTVLNPTGTPAKSGVPDQNRGNERETILAGPVGAKYVVNSTTSTAPIYNFNPITADISTTYLLESFPIYTGAFPVKVFADYMMNPAAQQGDQAYQVGVTFGKSGKKGTWDISYRWKYLESNAWYEELVDSDFGAFYQVGARDPAMKAFSNNPSSANNLGYSAGTNVKGHILKWSYSPYDALTLGVTYYLTDLITTAPNTGKSEVGRLQVDAVLKF